MKKFNTIYNNIIAENYDDGLERMIFGDKEDIDNGHNIVDQTTMERLWEEYDNTYGAFLSQHRPHEIEKYLYITDKVIITSKYNNIAGCIPGYTAKKIMEGADDVKKRAKTDIFLDKVLKQYKGGNDNIEASPAGYYIKILKSKGKLPHEGETATVQQMRDLTSLIEWMRFQRNNGCIVLETDIDDLIIRG